jgi:hypothetical protein
MYIELTSACLAFDPGRRRSVVESASQEHSMESRALACEARVVRVVLFASGRRRRAGWDEGARDEERERKGADGDVTEFGEAKRGIEDWIAREDVGEGREEKKRETRLVGSMTGGGSIRGKEYDVRSECWLWRGV